MRLEETSYKGRRAAEIIENPVFKEAWDGLRQAIHDKWESCPVRDVEGQHELKLMLKLMGDLESNLKHFINDGKIADVEISNEKMSKVKQFFSK